MIAPASPPQTAVWTEPVRGFSPDIRLYALPGFEVTRSFVDGRSLPPPLHYLTGLQFEEVEKGRVRLSLPVTRWLMAPQGVLPGSVLCLLADAALGAAVSSALPPATPYTAAELSICFLRPVREQTLLVATARTQHAGRTLSAAEVEIRDESGKVCATASGRFGLPSPLPVEPAMAASVREDPPAPVEPAWPSPHPYQRPATGEILAQELFDSRPGLRVLEGLASGELPQPPLHHLTGLRLERASDAEVVLRLPATRWLLGQQPDRCAAGAVAMLGGMAVEAALQSILPAGAAAATLDLKVYYLRAPPCDGRELEARATVVHRGRNLAMASAEVLDATGKRLAQVSGGAALFRGQPVDLIRPRQTEKPAEELDFVSKLGSVEFYNDPYRFYRALREKEPIHFTSLRGGSWVLTSYEAVSAALRDERLSNAVWGSGKARAGVDATAALKDERVSDTGVASYLTALPPKHRAELKPLADRFSEWLLFLDAPRHTRLRRLVGRAFAQNSIEALRPRVKAVVDGLLDPLVPLGRMDIIADFAYEIPLRVIMALLGLPEDRRPEFLSLSNDLAKLLGGAAPTVELARRGLEGIENINNYLREEVARRRKNPTRDILSVLVSAEENGEVLGEGEVENQVLALLFAGHETTRNLIGNGMLALLRNPDQLALLQQNPALIRSAVEELLRYDNSVQMVYRIVSHDLEFQGKAMEKGQFVLCFIGAANRDPAFLPDADRLDITREDNKHLSMGVPPHICVGGALARLQGQLAISALVERLPHIQLEAQPDYSMNLSLRGLKALQVRY